MNKQQVKRVLVTGGSGFFGGVLLHELKRRNINADSLDVLTIPDSQRHIAQKHHSVDIRNKQAIAQIIKNGNYDVIFHCAAELAHERVNDRSLWETNVTGTENILIAASETGVRHISYVSSNCVFGRSYPYPVTEHEPPTPIEIYGRAKLAGEKLALSEKYSLPSTAAFRTPTILDEGRIGLLGILFEFIHEGRKVWLIGGGRNRYQFIYAKDLASAMIQGAEQIHSGQHLFNVGSANVPTLKECFAGLIKNANSTSRLVPVPRRLSEFALRVSHALGISPLGPYHYRMIAADFIFDTSHISNVLGWKPTLTNTEALTRAYKKWAGLLGTSNNNDDRAISPHQRTARMGVLRILKLFS